MSGPLPITHSEIKAYAELMDLQFTPWEVSTLKVMDSAFLAESYKLIEGMT